MRLANKIAAICLALGTTAYGLPASAQYFANNLATLRALSQNLNDATITLAPGDYWIDGDHIANPTSSEPIFLELGGSGNTYNLAGANIKLDTRKLDGFGRALGHGSGVRVVKVSGTGNTVNGLNLTGYDLDLDTDPNAQRHADWAAVYVQLTGTDNTMNSTNVLTRGSSPYGLGDAFGKGARQFPQGEPPGQVAGEPEGVVGHPWIGHNKTSAFNVWGANGAVIDDMHLDVRTYGHGFFVQQSDDTTLTNSTVTGQLFPSTNVSTHPKYIEYGGITKDGNPIPDDIFISGAEDGVRMYTGASNLTVDNVVVTNMRSGFAVALGSGNINLNDVETYGAEHGFDFRSNTTITGAKGDIVNGPLIWHPYGNSANSSIDVELVGDAPIGHDWAAAFISGNNVDATISSELPAGALGEHALIRFGQRWWNDWRDHDDLDDFDEQAFDYINSSFTNNTNQTMVLGIDVTNNTGSSQAPVVTNGKENYYDGISLVPIGKRTVLVHPAGLGNNGASADGTLESNASIVEAGATLELQPGIRIQDEKLSIAGDGVDGNGALYSDGSNDSNTRFGSSNSGDESTIFLDGDSSIGVGIAGNQLLVGRIQGTGNLTKLGAGTLTIGKSSTFTGDLSVAQGHVTARPGVVHTNLTVAYDASISGIGTNAFNTAGIVLLDGEMDLNGRTDANSLSQQIGRLYGSGHISSSNPTAGAEGTLIIEGASGEADFSGVISTHVNLVKAGDSFQALFGANTYTGTTTVTGGVLLVNGSHTGGDDYTVAASGTLGGSGVISSSVVVQSGGTLAPGASAGQLTIDAVQLQTGGVMEIELGGPSEHDLLSVETIVLGGDLEVTLLDTFIPYASDSFTVVAATDSLTGAFDNVVHGQRVDTADGEGSFRVLYDTGLGQVILDSFVPSGLLADFNQDGMVDAVDYALWREANGQTGLIPYTSADATGDGMVDQDDYLVWQASYGAIDTSTLSAAVPEPTNLALFVTTAMCLISLPARKTNSLLETLSFESTR